MWEWFNYYINQLIIQLIFDHWFSFIRFLRLDAWCSMLDCLMLPGAAWCLIVHGPWIKARGCGGLGASIKHHRSRIVKSLIDSMKNMFSPKRFKQTMHHASTLWNFDFSNSIRPSGGSDIDNSQKKTCLLLTLAVGNLEPHQLTPEKGNPFVDCAMWNW